MRELHGITGVDLTGPNCLLFLDEIQATPHAIAALRYFYEEVPDLPVIAAGSLLEFTLADHAFSMPVGRIQYGHLGPMSFREYLMAVDASSVQWLDRLGSNGDPIPDTAHRKLCEHQRLFMIIGGMPEAVLAYSETSSLHEVTDVHRSIMDSYVDDLAKYARQSDLARLQKLIQAIPRQIGLKVKYSSLSREDSSTKARKCLDLLAKARLCTKVHHSTCAGVPLGATQSDTVFKLLFLDVGLAAHACGTSWTSIAELDERTLINEGVLAEQYVGQHLAYAGGFHVNPMLHYWLREGKRSNAEVDFAIPHDSTVIPIEVKAGKRGSLRSLHQYIYAKQPELAVRFDLNPLSIQDTSFGIRTPNGDAVAEGKLLSMPMYGVGEVHRVIRSVIG